MEINRNVIGWFEIPVIDMERAMLFYENVFGFKLQRVKMDSLDMAWFPYIEGAEGSSGSLVCQEDYYQPSTDGVLVYFTAHSGDLSIELGRVEDAGGTVLMQKTPISPEHGYYGLFTDSEGNRIAIHSRK